MTKIPTLYDKLKPRVRARLKENEGKYSSSVRQVIGALKSNHFVSDLTIEQVRHVHLFSDTDYTDLTAIAFMWCDEIFDIYERNN